MAINSISSINVPTPTTDLNATNKNYVDTAIIPEWNNTTYYKRGNVVRHTRNNVTRIYQSVQGPNATDTSGTGTYYLENVGQVPFTNPMYWKEVSANGTFAGTYNVNTTYSLNDLVLYNEAFFISNSNYNLAQSPYTNTSAWTLVGANSNLLRHIGITTATGTSSIASSTLASGYGCYTLLGNSSQRTFVFPYYESDFSTLRTFEFVIRLQNKRTNNQSDTVTTTFQYKDASNNNKDLYLLDGTNQMVLDKGYTYFFVFREFPSFYASNISDYTYGEGNNNTSSLLINPDFNIRQWTGNLQGRVPLVPST